MSSIAAKRPQFFEGQYLGANDLDALVAYHRDQVARHRLAGHTWGIAMGLRLKEVESPAGGGEVDVYIQPGYAWDGFGRPVVVPAPYKLPPEKFKDITASGRVKVWLRYAQTESGAPPPGFETCETAGQYARVQESFDVAVGGFSHAEQHAKLTIGGSPVTASDALHHLDSGDPWYCDESVPFQALPGDAENPRWLIPLGYVTWEPGAVGRAGRFTETTDEATLKLSRSERVYVGVVAEAVQAADGVIRLRDRGTPAPSSGPFSAACERQVLDTGSDRDLEIKDDVLSPVDLVWVEGNLRALGDVKLFGSKLDIRDDRGEPGARLFFDDTAKLEGLTIETVAAGNAELRMSIKCTGQIGIGTDEPSAYHEYADDLVIKTDGDAGITVVSGQTHRGLLHFADGTSGDERYRGYLHYNHEYDHLKIGVAGSDKMILLKDGNVGIGTNGPQETLDVRGNIALGDAGDLYAIGGIENLRIIIGYVDADGTKLSGGGFDSSRTDTGIYRVDFNTAFSAPPVVVASLFDAPGFDNVITITAMETGYFTARTTDVEQGGSQAVGAAQATAFTFIAIGKR